MRVLVVSSSPRESSISRKLARRALDHAARAHDGHEADWLDLHETQVEPFRGFEAEYGPQTRAVGARMREADAFVLVSPVYNGSYASALKNIFEHAPQKSLVGRVAGFCLVGGGSRSFLQARTQLASLMEYFYIHSVPRAVYALERDLEEGVPEALDARVRGLVDDVVAITGRVRRERAATTSGLDTPKPSGQRA